MLGSVSEIFGMDLSGQDPLQNLNDQLRQDRSNWVNLSYLSLSVFLLKQMDRLLQMQPEERGRKISASTSPSGELDQEPWHYNSLNILFLDPYQLAAHNATGMDQIMKTVADNNRLEEFHTTEANDYAQVVLNLIKATKMEGKGIDCIWTVYCIELNNRASLEGITNFSSWQFNLEIIDIIYKGIAGAVARINGVFLEMTSGTLTPAEIVNRLILSFVRWNDLDCNKLFPT